MDQGRKAEDAKRASALKPGTVLAEKFVIERLLAEGAMGRVYLARQEPMGRHVALKLMRQGLNRDPKAVKRFLQEAVAVSKLKHPNTITLFDFGRSEDGQLYLAMELVDGRSLKEVLAKKRRLGLRRTVRIVSQVALSLVEAHRKGIIHRDLKPANILLVDLEGQPDFVKVIDFGIAQLGDTERADRITEAGVSCGTPAYMSPEQFIGGAEIDGRSDLFTLGAIMYEMLEGRRPFAAQTTVAGLARKRSGKPDAMSEWHPKSIRDFVLRLLSRDPDDRPDSAEVLLVELRAALPPGIRLDHIELPKDEAFLETTRVDVSVTSASSADAHVAAETSTSTPGLRTLVAAEAARAAETEDLWDRRAGPADRAPAGGGIPLTSPTPEEDSSPLPVASIAAGTLRKPARNRLRIATIGLVLLAGMALAVVTLLPTEAPESASRSPSSPPVESVRTEATEFRAAGAQTAETETAADTVTEDETANVEAVVTEPVRVMPDELPPTETVVTTELGRATLGAACSTDEHCESRHCSNGHCAPVGYAYIPAGRFLMGSPRRREEVLHEVVITRPFFLSQMEVTQQEWSALMDRLNTHHPNCGDDCPAENNRWSQAALYLNTLSRRAGLEECYVIDREEVRWPQGLDCQGYRFPTEAEWEYAARAGSTTDYPCGDRPDDGDPTCLDEMAWTRRNAGRNPHPVGLKPPNAFGLHDIIGNAWEWVWDRHGEYPPEPQIDPAGPGTGRYHIRRGCGYNSTLSACETAARNTYGRAGVRPARSAPRRAPEVTDSPGD